MAAPGTKARIKGLRNLFVAPLSTDTAATTAYGTAISLGAGSKLSFQPQGKTADLESSVGIENSHTTITHSTFSIEFGELDLAVLDLILGGKKYSDATGGKDIFAYVKNSIGGYFGLFGQPYVTEGGPADFYLALLKCRVENPPPFDLDKDNWAKQTISGRAFYTLKDGLLFGMANLTATSDVTASAVLTDLQTAIASGS